MLALTRREGESIVIGGNIVVTVMAVKSSNQVVLGIKAPEHIKILREELIEEIEIRALEGTETR